MPDVRRTRYRRPSLRIKKEEISSRVCELLSRAEAQMEPDRELRIQREAKLRLWSEGDIDWPWPGASDVGLPMMLEKSLRTQDTLCNAAMSSRPVVRAQSTVRADKAKEGVIDALIDYQVFVEQDGEEVISELAQAFVDDGVAVAFIPWITEKSEVTHTDTYEPLPEDADPAAYFSNILQEVFPDVTPDGFELAGSKDGWDWKIHLPESTEKEEETVDVSFYTRANDQLVEIVYRSDVVVYDGPRIIPKEYDEVYAPPRSANLQPPSPANPRGAPYVVLVDRPTLDEVSGLVRSGFYDLPSREDLAGLYAVASSSGGDSPVGQARDDFQGTTDGPGAPKDRNHGRLTRLMCFDRYDIDGDGQPEDVVWWVIKEAELLLKARRLTEVFPSNPPRRPLVEGTFIPVRGRRVGVSLGELTEGMQDASKVIIDQIINAGDMSMNPPAFYRPQGAMQPEVIRMTPGEMYPLGDPSRDVKQMTMANSQAVGFGLNMFTLFQQMSDRLTMIGDTELGRVPAGKSSALRTASGMAQLSAKGDARPERILRRFFRMLTQIWSIIHQHNQRRLPRNKQILIGEWRGPHEAPYLDIPDKSFVAGVYNFSFKANSVNTARDQLQASLDQMMAVYLNPLSLQMGLVDQDGAYRLIRDWTKAKGGDPDQYLKPPLPSSILPKISAEEAITALFAGTPPFGLPSEAGGWVEHTEKLQLFTEMSEFGMFNDEQVQAYAEYFQQAMANAQAQAAQQQAMEEAAGAAPQKKGGAREGAGRPAEKAGPNMSNPQLSGGAELLDESLPTAGGGGK